MSMRFIKRIKLMWKYRTLSYRKSLARHKNFRRKQRRKDLIAKVGMCQKCKRTENLTIDHIIPRAKGGSKHGHHNLQVLCSKCNRYKGDKLPQKTRLDE